MWRKDTVFVVGKNEKAGETSSNGLKRSGQKGSVQDFLLRGWAMESALELKSEASWLQILEFALMTAKGSRQTDGRHNETSSAAATSRKQVLSLFLNGLFPSY